MYGWVRCAERYGGLVPPVGYTVRYGTVQVVRYYDGTVVQCIAPTVPLHRTTLMYPKFGCKKCKYGCQKCKIGCQKCNEIGCENFPNFGTLVGVQCAPAQCHRTVPAYRLHRTIVPTIPYQRTDRTVPLYPPHRTSVPIQLNFL